MLAPEYVSIIDDATRPATDELILELGYKEVHLDFFLDCQEQIASLQSGDELKPAGKGCTNAAGKLCLKFSKSLLKNLENLESQGYRLVNARIAFIVYWKKANPESPEIKIILPVLYLKRHTPG